MKSEVKKLDRLKRTLKIEISEGTVLKDKGDIYKQLAGGFKIPGFRPGNAPLELVEKYHKKAFEEEFLRKMIPSYYSKALEGNKIIPVSSPRIYDVDFSGGKLSFSAEFEVRPDIELKDEDYKGIKVKAKAAKVEEIEVDKFITQMNNGIEKITKRDYCDEDIAKWAGYASKESFREAVRSEIFLDKLRSQHISIESAVMKELMERIKLEVPQAVVKSQEEQLFNQEVSGLRAKGIKDEDIKKYENEIKEKVKSLSVRQVKLYYILEAIAKKESLNVNEHNLTEAVMGFILSCAQYSL